MTITSDQAPKHSPAQSSKDKWTRVANIILARTGNADLAKRVANTTVKPEFIKAEIERRLFR